jgi:pimeloyl-ACP methyl ester carboxylesterase
MNADASLYPPHFIRQSVQTSGATINLTKGGEGPPLLLLHGYPQTHIEWRKSAPALAKDFTVVMPDLRGCGDSSKPDVDYRAAATVDLENDRADLGEKITCPLLVLWGARGVIGALYDPIAVPRERASDVRGKALPGGHWLPEERPNETLAELRTFLGG